ncbi:MAG: hypothetical protein AB7S38_36340, partial [Vulcanimicrobiota bacterium]
MNRHLAARNGSIGRLQPALPDSLTALGDTCRASVRRGGERLAARDGSIGRLQPALPALTALG